MMSRLVWSILLILTLNFVTVVRLECTSGALLRAQCNTLNNKAFLLHESQIGSERIRCNFGATSYSWSRSSDGSVANSVLLDTSSNKYTVVNHNSLDITFSNVTGAQDGGLYRCVYGSIGTTPELCIYVYERAVFASCSQEYSGCYKETSLSIVTGNNAIFNASIVYTPGGNCDFKQEITRIKLTKINEQSDFHNTLLFTCRTSHGARCVTNDGRISMSQGNGLDFVFTLSNATVDDSGAYEAVVEGTHPATGSLITIKKKFQLSVVAISSPPPPPFGVQGLCSVVVWYGPENITCESMISGYEVMLYDPNLPASNVTRYVGANRTFYILTEEDRVANEKTNVQVRSLHKNAVGEWSEGISMGCNKTSTQKLRLSIAS